MSHEYLMLQLVRIGVKNPISGNDGVLYFVFKEKHYRLQPVIKHVFMFGEDNEFTTDSYELVDYSPKHNELSVVNNKYTIDGKECLWRRVLEIVQTPTGECDGKQEKEGSEG